MSTFWRNWWCLHVNVKITESSDGTWLYCKKKAVSKADIWDPQLGWSLWSDRWLLEGGDTWRLQLWGVFCIKMLHLFSAGKQCRLCPQYKPDLGAGVLIKILAYLVCSGVMLCDVEGATLFGFSWCRCVFCLCFPFGLDIQVTSSVPVCPHPDNSPCHIIAAALL